MIGLSQKRPFLIGNLASQGGGVEENHSKNTTPCCLPFRVTDTLGFFPLQSIAMTTLKGKVRNRIYIRMCDHGITKENKVR